MDSKGHMLRALMPFLSALDRYCAAAGSGSPDDGGGLLLAAVCDAARSVPGDARAMCPSIQWGHFDGAGRGDGGPEGMPGAALAAKAAILAELGLDEGTLVHYADTEYSFAIVMDSTVEGRPARLLFLDGVLSSGEYADGGPALYYPREVMRAFELLDSPKRALVMGVAAGTIVNILRRSFPEMRVDCVDIDPGVVEIGKKFFTFRDGGMVRTFIADGRRHLEGNAGPYDFVVMDAFMGLSPVPHLSSVEFVRELKAKLSPGAVCAVNVIAKVERAGYLQHAYGTWHSAFTDVIALPLCGEGETFNIVLVATDRDTRRFREKNASRIFGMEHDPSQTLTDKNDRILGLSPF